MNKLGFGFLRFPMDGDRVRYDILTPMVDAFFAAGGTYIDTAYPYLNGKSEEAVRETVVKRYPRDRYLIANKLPGYDVKTYEDCYAYFEESLKRCGVDYFDVYMLHWLDQKHYALAEKYDEFRFLRELKASGKAKRIGFSFHDTAELLDEILTKHPEVDCVLLQINYLDWESEGVQSRRCYETAVRHGKSVIVMEPVKGGTLARVPEKAAQILKALDPERSPAFHALRFVQSLPHVEVVLSGMAAVEQMEENLLQVEPMTEQELELLRQAAEAISEATAVACTGCGYCVKHCPKNIAIPEYFRLYNENRQMPRHAWKQKPAYHEIARERGKASDCISCGACEKKCPQKLPIREHLAALKEVMEG
ncbi:MAG: aldo/keto reductase [Oscillospiraceae bacterium]|nr:aldo/keto reductase [Oscillospiraceae bacterium]